jgi:glutamyl-tRNA synthetase
VFDFERVNRAGARFDWDKLNWLNAQVLHSLTPGDLLAKLLPLWQEKGWGVSGATADTTWQIDLCELLGPSLTLLADGVEQAAPFFERPVRDAAAAGQLAAEGAGAALAAVADAIPEGPLEPVAAKALLDTAATAAGVKKGVVMKSLRAALLGSLQGPDLLATWGLLHRIGEDAPRLADAVQSSSRAE